MNKNLFTNKILWCLIFVVSLIIYIIINCDNNEIINTNIIRQKINKKYPISKKIYISPKIINNEPTTKMTNKLTQKLNKISEGFNNEIKQKYIIKLFYANWCNHCMEFKPIWLNLKNKYSNYLHFIEVDCTNSNPNLSYVVGFPTIGLFDLNDKYIESYENDRSINLFESYIKNKIL